MTIKKKIKGYNITLEGVEANQGYFTGFDIAAFTESEALDMLKCKAMEDGLNIIHFDSTPIKLSSSIHKTGIIKEYGKSFFELD